MDDEVAVDEAYQRVVRVDQSWSWESAPTGGYRIGRASESHLTLDRLKTQAKPWSHGQAAVLPSLAPLPQVSLPRTDKAMNSSWAASR